jgi:hypothetical protein
MGQATSAGEPEALRGYPPRTAPGVVRLLCLAALAAGLWGLWRVGSVGAVSCSPDFEYFYKAGASLLAHGSLDPGYDVSSRGRVVPRGTCEWYMPFVSRLFSLLAWMKPQVAGRVWLAFNLAGLLWAVRIAGRLLSGLPQRDWPVTQLVPCLLLSLYWFWEFRLNQVNAFTLLLLLGSLVCLERGKQAAGGLWLGLAALIKLTPLLLVVWLVLKRWHRAALSAVATVVLFGPVADLIIFGPKDGADVYASWWDAAVVRGSSTGLILSQKEMDWRNQGLGAVASRWLHPTNYNTRFDNDPRLPDSREVLTINVASLSRTTVAWLASAVQFAVAVGLVVLSRRAARAAGPWQLRAEWTLWVLAMLWFMPVMRGYHVIFAYPAIALLCGALHYHGLVHWWSLLVLLALEGLVAGQASAVWMEAQALGAILGSVVLLAVPLVVLIVRLSRGSIRLPVLAGGGGS